VLRVRVGRRRRRAAHRGTGALTVAGQRTTTPLRTRRDITARPVSAPPGAIARGPGVTAYAPDAEIAGIRSGAEPEAAAPTTIPLLPGARTPLRRAQFAVVSGCTLVSLSLGVVAILLAVAGHVQFAAVCLILSVACDGLDGALARRFGVCSPFGAQLDSLADMCSFGVAAPVVAYASLAGTVPPAAAGVACFLMAACAAIRLARFNVSPKDGRFFTGVPTTMAAAVLAVAMLVDLPLAPAAQLAGVAVLAFAMVSGFPYAKLARIARLPAWLWLLPLAGALLNAQLTFVVVVAGYLVSGPVLWLHQRQRATAG
jgi:CDP-diacylglycerol--serine O-phosphatidyltransferase